MSTAISPYVGREQTEIKHFILRKYLERLTYKAGSYPPYNFRLCYVDCFAGPWKSNTEDLSDTSPSIAIKELLKAKDGLSEQRGIDLQLKAMFIEKGEEAFKQLEPFVGGFDGITTKAVQGEFEENISNILKFANTDFTFFFIDPTGWSGFGMKKIAPVLNYRPGEVLINFMTDHIFRFVNSNQDPEGFIDLFGSADARNEWANLSGLEKEEKIIQTYCRHIKRTGGFRYVVSAIILNPNLSKTYFHLIYGTRSDAGLRVFREVEQKAMAEQEKIRCELQAKSNDNNGQTSLFSLLETPAEPEPVSSETSYFIQLRNQYLHSSKKIVTEAMQSRKSLPFEELEMIALENTLTWNSDLKGWLRELEQDDKIKVSGRTPRETTFKKGHTISWTGS